MGYCELMPKVVEITGQFNTINKIAGGEASWADVKPMKVSEEPSIFSKIFHPTRTKKINEQRQQAIDFNNYLKQMQELEKLMDKPIEQNEVGYY